MKRIPWKWLLLAILALAASLVFFAIKMGLKPTEDLNNVTWVG